MTPVPSSRRKRPASLSEGDGFATKTPYSAIRRSHIYTYTYIERENVCEKEINLKPSALEENAA